MFREWLRIPVWRVSAEPCGAAGRTLPAGGRLAVAVVAGILAAGRGAAALRRRLARRRSVAVAGALAWRAGASLVGIAAAAALVSAFTVAEADQTVASLLDPRRSAPPAPRQAVPLAPSARTALADWEPIARPIAMFGLETPWLGDGPRQYSARRSADESRREDRLQFGVLDGPAPHLLMRVTVDRAGPRRPDPFLVTLARDAAAQGLGIGRAGTVSGLATGFGLVETADVVLAGEGHRRACIAFRLDGASQVLAFGGWWCGTDGKPADRTRLACLIERLDLLSAGQDRELRGLFARAELDRRPGCSPPRLSASGRKTSWLDADGKAPPLRSAAQRRSAQTR
jgi:hypothetical protein